MWIAVRRRFRGLDENLLPDSDGLNNVARVAIQVAESLSRSYYDESRTGDHFYVVGSRLKNTAVRGISDIDLYYFPPASEFVRFDSYIGNGQSAFLQDIKNRLAVTYPQTRMRGDGQVVIVNFNSICVEVAPAYQPAGGPITIPYSGSQGKWITATPTQELARLNELDNNYAGNVRKVIRGVKAWADHCNVPLKSFLIEVLVSEFAQSVYYFKYDEYWYDWLYRDFFKFLLSKKNSFLFVPATNEVKSLGEAWHSRAETAFQRSVKACAFEYTDNMLEAGLEWRKIFGNRIPVYV